jgi:hypothetical protein
VAFGYASSVDLSVGCWYDVERRRIRFARRSIGELCRENTRQSRRRPAATGASVPAVRQASRRLTSFASSGGRDPNGVRHVWVRYEPDRLEYSGPATGAAKARETGARDLGRGGFGRFADRPGAERMVTRVPFSGRRTSATRAPRPCGLRRTCVTPSERTSVRSPTTVATWLILPVVICLSQRLSHACLSTNLYTVKLRMAH